MRLIERYQSGEYQDVWDDILRLGAEVRNEPLLTEILEVTHETMLRVKNNVELLVSRLAQLNYHFEYPKEVYQPPDKIISEQINYVEKLAGPLPLSIKVFYEVVGSVNFIGDHPKLSAFNKPLSDGEYNPCLISDPLVIYPLETSVQEYVEWKELHTIFEPEFQAGFHLIIAPDYWHKANFSGGGPYYIKAPDLAADAIVKDEGHDFTFVEYLRHCFKWDGLPGLARSNYHPEELAFLTEGLAAI